MATSQKTVVFNTGTGAAATTVSITGAGFAPKAVIFFATGQVSAVDAGSAADSQRMLGFAANTTLGGGIKNRVHGSRAGNGNTAAAGFQNDNAQHIDGCILTVGNGGGTTGLCHVSAFTSDGCTLTIDTQFAASLRVVAHFLGGSDLTDIEVGEFTSPTTGTTPFTADITTGITCTDDQAVLFLLGGGRNTNDNDNSVDSDLAFGVATSPTSRFAWLGGGDDTAAGVAPNTVTKRWLVDAALYGNPTGSFANVSRRADFDSWIASGFRIRWNAVSSVASRLYWLVIKGGQWKVLSGNTATSLTTVVLTGAGFAPTGGLVLSHGIVESVNGLSGLDNGDVCSIGAFTGAANRAAMGMFATHGATTSAIGTRVEHDEAYAQCDAAGAVVGLMDVQSMDSDGVTFVMDDADPTAAFFCVLLGGSTGGGGGGASSGGGVARRRRRR